MTMIEAPQITETEKLHAAVIHLEILRAQMQTEMPAAIQEIQAALQAQNTTPTGPLFAHHLTTSSERFDFEVGFPVDAPVSPTGRVEPGTLPGTKVARSVYRGPYEGLFSAWDEFGKQAAAKATKRGSRPGPTLWESYLSGPETDPDPSTWRTELNVSLLEPAS